MKGFSIFFVVENLKKNKNKWKYFVSKLLLKFYYAFKAL